MVFARYVKTGRTLSPAFSPATRAARSTGSARMPAVVSTATDLPSASGDTLTPRSSSDRPARSAAAPLVPFEIRIVLTLPLTSRSRWIRRNGAKTARTAVCCGRSANSPSCSRGKTPVRLSLMVRPMSSFRPNSDSTGTCDGRCSRVSRTSPSRAPISAASAGEMKMPSRCRSPLNVQNRSSTP